MSLLEICDILNVIMENRMNILKISAISFVVLVTSCAVDATKSNDKQYTVTFDTQGGSSIDPVVLADGSILNKPAASVRTGYSFVNWYTDSSFNNLWNFESDKVTGDITLYAKWSANKYTVSFDINGGAGSEIMKEFTMTFDTTVTLAANTYTNNTSTFIGWATSENGDVVVTDQGDFKLTTEGVTLYAVWMQLPHIAGSLKYNFDNTNKSFSVEAENTDISGDITIPDSLKGIPVTTIPYCGFLQCVKLTSLTIPESVTTIGETAFYGCTVLESVNIPGGVTRLYDGTFVECFALKSITIPNGVTHIGSSVFYSCSGLTSITIPDSVTTIGHGAFALCTSLNTIIMPGSFTHIESDAFINCGNIKTVNISEGSSKIDDQLFDGWSTLVTVNIPDSVNTIGEGAFMNCTSLKNVNIPEGVTTIQTFTFSGCSVLETITIPSSVTTFGFNPFNNCTSIGDVYMYPMNAPNVPSGTGFTGASATLHIKSGATGYDAAPWNDSGLFPFVETDI